LNKSVEIYEVLQKLISDYRTSKTKNFALHFKTTITKTCKTLLDKNQSTCSETWRTEACMLWPAFHFHSVLLIFVTLWPISTLCVADMVHAVADMVCGRYRRFPFKQTNDDRPTDPVLTAGQPR